MAPCGGVAASRAVTRPATTRSTLRSNGSRCRWTRSTAWATRRAAEAGRGLSDLSARVRGDGGFTRCLSQVVAAGGGVLVHLDAHDARDARLSHRDAVEHVGAL